MEYTGATRCASKMLGNAHRVIGSAAKSAVVCPHHNPVNAVPLPLSDNGIRQVKYMYLVPL